jgi:pyruvate,water dikinase
VTVDAFDRFLDDAGLRARIAARLANLDTDDTGSLERAADDVQAWIASADVPTDVRVAVDAAYGELSRRAATDATLVAVRSSGTVEDAADTSFAGMFRSYLNVRGVDDLHQQLRQCWASLFTARAIAYRARTSDSTDMPRVAVVVQQMVDADRSGVIFTIDPTTGNREHVVIEAAWGLGELVVQGDVRPDRYVVDKNDLRILERAISHKDAMLVRSAQGGNERVELDEARATARALSDDGVRRLAELAIKDEAHYGRPQDAEFAASDGQMFFVQTRPITAGGRRRGRRHEPRGRGPGPWPWCEPGPRVGTGARPPQYGRR